MSPVVWSRLGIEAAKEITTAMDYLRWHARGRVNTAANPFQADTAANPFPIDKYVDAYESATGDSLTKYRWAPRRFSNAVRRCADALEELRGEGAAVSQFDQEQGPLSAFVNCLSPDEPADDIDRRVLEFVDLVGALSQDRHRYSASLEELLRTAARFSPESFTKTLRDVVTKRDGWAAFDAKEARVQHYMLVSWAADTAQELGSKFKPNTVVGSLFALSHRGERRLVERFLNIFQRMDAIEKGVKGRMSRNPMMQVPIYTAYGAALETFVYAVASHDELTDAGRMLIESAFCVFECNDIGGIDLGTPHYDEYRLDIFVILAAILSCREACEEAKRNAAELTYKLLKDTDSYANISSGLKKLLGLMTSAEPAQSGPRRASSRPSGRRALLGRGPASKRPIFASRMRPAAGARIRHSL